VVLAAGASGDPYQPVRQISLVAFRYILQIVRTAPEQLGIDELTRRPDRVLTIELKQRCDVLLPYTAPGFPRRRGDRAEYLLMDDRRGGIRQIIRVPRLQQSLVHRLAKQALVDLRPLAVPERIRVGVDQHIGDGAPVGLGLLREDSATDTARRG